MAVPFLVVFLADHPRPTRRQGSGGGPPPQDLRTAGQPRQVGWGLGGGGDRSHIFTQPAGQDLDREGGNLAGGPERDGRLPTAAPCPTVVVSASSPARWASAAGSASELARRMPRSMTRRRRA